MNDNNKLIFELIKNQYGYTEESLKFVEEQLEKRDSDIYINELFKNSVDDRLYFPMSNEYKEKIDEGWAIFKNMFVDFTHFHEMSYNDFVENKVLVDKNSLKIKKALVAFYLKKRAEKKISGSLNIKAENSVMLSYEFGKHTYEIIESDNNAVRKLVFEESEGRIDFLRSDTFQLRYGTSNFNNPVKLLGAMRLNNNPTIKTSPCSVISILKSEGLAYLFVNKVSNGGLTFFRRMKFSQEDTEKYFSKSIFLTPTNDDRIVKLWYLNNENCICSAHLIISREDGSVTFDSETTSKIVVPADVKFTVIEKEKYTELFFSYVENKYNKVIKIITENCIDFFITNTDLSKDISSGSNYTLFYKDFTISYSTERNGFKVSVLTSNNKISDEVKKIIESDISSKLEEVGARSLPKNKDINVVVSRNFADWFLCSTSETWSSCLNLESKHSSIHWQGLPALLGDKDRVMFYVTDGTKKTYKGICVDKFLTRTWGMLDNKNKFNIIKFYPIEMLGVPDLSSITSLQICLIKNSFVSKNPIRVIEFNYSDRFYLSSFIFQDKTSFVKMSDGFHISFSTCNGHYSIIRDREKNTNESKQVVLFEYDGGFSLLLEKNRKITDYFRRLDLSDARCSMCGRRIREGDESFHPNTEENETLCDNCYYEHYFNCHVCHNVFRKEDDDYIFLEDEGNEIYVCNCCKKNNTIQCDECHEYILKNYETRYCNEENHKTNLCVKCAITKEVLKNTEQCMRCNTYFHKSVLLTNKIEKDFRLDTFCGKCLFELSDIKQAKFSFIVK